MRKTRQLHERATLAVTPIALVIAQAQTTTTAKKASPVPSVVPDARGAPGGKGLQDAINVFAFYGILAAIAGFLLGGAVWAVGGRAGNDYAAQGGKVGMAVAVGVAFLIGASSAIISFAFNAGGT
jgi:vacuolar-type H+-ATPase subunit I/STV1